MLTMLKFVLEVYKTSDRINEIYKEVDELDLKSILEDMFIGDKSIMLLPPHSQINATIHIYNKRSKKEFTEMMSISEMESYLKKNKHISQRITEYQYCCYGVSGMSYRSDQGWKKHYQKLQKHIPQSALANEVGKKSIKQIKTEQVVKKHRARQNAKNK